MKIREAILLNLQTADSRTWQSPGSMSSFSIFTVLYMTAFLLEMVEKWKYPSFTLIFLGLVTLLVCTRMTRLKFLFFLVITTAYFLIFRFPDVANHVNLILYLNSVLIIGMIYVWTRRPDLTTDDDYYNLMRPTLRASLVIVYFWAGFHKLNTDFLNPQVSCAQPHALSCPGHGSKPICLGSP